MRLTSSEPQHSLRNLRWEIGGRRGGGRGFCRYELKALTTWRICTALQRQNTEFSKQIFPEKEYRGLGPNFHIHASVSGLYISTIGLPILLEEICRVDRSWDYINRSQTHECWNWGWGRALPRKGIHKWDFRYSVSMLKTVFTVNKVVNLQRSHSTAT
jgi:hypothetical protein